MMASNDMITKFKIHVTEFFLIFSLFLISNAKAQTPIKLKLIGVFIDSVGYSYDTLYFGFHKDGAPGFQPGLDVVDTVKFRRWGTFDETTLGYYKTNMREFEPFTYTQFDIYTRNTLRYITWDTAEFNPSFYNYDFKSIVVALETNNAHFEFPWKTVHVISGDNQRWKETNGVNPIDSVRIFVEGTPIELYITLGVADSIPTALPKELTDNNFSFYHISGTHEVQITNPNELTLTAILTNSLGQTVFSLNNLSQAKMEFQIPNLPQGIYYLQLSSENNTQTKTIGLVK